LKLKRTRTVNIVRAGNEVLKGVLLILEIRAGWSSFIDSWELWFSRFSLERV